MIMQHLFTWISVALAIILIYSLRVNGKKLKRLQKELEKQEKEEIQKINDIESYRLQLFYLHQSASGLEKQNKELVERIMGERVCDGYCRSCTNSVEYQGRISCKLDCKCKDFNAKEQSNG